MLSLVRLFLTPWTIASQALLSMGFPGKNIAVGCYFLLQGIFLTQGANPGGIPGIEPESLASPALAGGFFTTVPPLVPVRFFFNQKKKKEKKKRQLAELRKQAEKRPKNSGWMIHKVGCSFLGKKKNYYYKIIICWWLSCSLMTRLSFRILSVG